jgi:hypothetical protein
MHSVRGPVKMTVWWRRRVGLSRPAMNEFIRKGAEKSAICPSNRRELPLAEGEGKAGNDS